MKIRVLQSHSICYRGTWYNQGEVLEVPEGTEFLTIRPKYDSKGKLLGQETVSQVEPAPAEAAAANTIQPEADAPVKEEG